MADRSRTHLVLIPSYNPGAKVYETVRGALAHWSPVWVVVDGSTDGTPEGLARLAAEEPRVRVIVLEKNAGKGSAVLHGCELARPGADEPLPQAAAVESATHLRG